MKKVDKRIIKTKKAIQEAFMELLKKKEFDQITVAELARHAQIDRKTFYLHYANTETLIRAFEHQQVEMVALALNQTNGFSVTLFIDTLNDVLKKNDQFYRLISRTGRNSFFLKNCEKMVYKLLKESISGNRKLSRQEAYHLKFISTGIVSVYMDWLRKHTSDDLSEIKEILESILAIHLKAFRGGLARA